MGKTITYTQTPDIIEANNRARLFTFEYNKLSPIEKGEKETLLGEALGGIGQRCTIHPPFACDVGKNIFLGDDVFINYNCVILDMHNVFIGNHVMIAPNVTITTATHSLSKIERRGNGGVASEIHIEDDVWIGCNVSIMPGVRIGEGSVIGAGSVVTKDVPANSLVFGVPGKVIRSIK